MTDAKNINKPLFSHHYLDYRIQESPEWQLDITSIWFNRGRKSDNSRIKRSPNSVFIL